MGLARTAFLKASQSRWLAEQATQRAFARRAVRRFLPGEDLDSALGAADELAKRGIATVLTQLGENVTTAEEATAVAAHYADLQRQIRARGLPSHMSVKLTHLGLDVSVELCTELVTRLAGDLGGNDLLWIDMEGAVYTDRTLDLYRRVRTAHERVGVCLQAYLHRTADDLRALLSLRPTLRLVKGAYQEPPALALTRKQDVDASYLALATQLLSPDVRARCGTPGFGTHDMRLVEAITAHAARSGVPKDAFEVQMLYGIRRSDQLRLAEQGYRVRVLISYGPAWFPWYMRRLAERPANVWFVVRSVFGG